MPHIVIFLNDVQRKKTKRANEYGISATFLPGHFKAYTIKLNPLDGVYYCDIRPNMVTDHLLSQHIKTIDHFFYADLWELLDRQEQTLDEVVIEEGENPATHDCHFPFGLGFVSVAAATRRSAASASRIISSSVIGSGSSRPLR